MESTRPERTEPDGIIPDEVEPEDTNPRHTKVVQARLTKLLSTLGDLVTAAQWIASLVFLLALAYFFYWVYLVIGSHCKWFGPGSFPCEYLNLCASAPLCAFIDAFDSTVGLAVSTNQEAQHLLVAKQTAVALERNLWKAMGPFQGKATHPDAQNIITSLLEAKKEFDFLKRDTQEAYEENVETLNSLASAMQDLIQETHRSLHASGGDWTESVRLALLGSATPFLASASERLSSDQNRFELLASRWKRHGIIIEGISRKIAFLPVSLSPLLHPIERQQPAVGDHENVAILGACAVIGGSVFFVPIVGSVAGPVAGLLCVGGQVVYNIKANSEKQLGLEKVDMILQSVPEAMMAVQEGVHFAQTASLATKGQATRLLILVHRVNDAHLKMQLSTSSSFSTLFAEVLFVKNSLDDAILAASSNWNALEASPPTSQI